MPSASLAALHPLVADWFLHRFDAPTDAQSRAWARIQQGRDVLISAPTGSGKTLAAFLICLDRLVRDAAGAGLPQRVDVLYVSPLKALSNDIHRNLEVPLAEITELAASRGQPLDGIRAMVRTGDTPAWERQRMAIEPPHVLVTTPESLFILLTSESGRRALSGVSTVIVDEIHAVVDDKRGAHLALSLARLDALVEQAGRPAPQRIGLSATVQPIGEVARFLTERDVDIVDSGHRRALDLAVEVPRDELGPVASNEMWGEIYDRIAELILQHRTTLVFVNTRRLAERVAHHLGERLGDEAVLAHHGSLSRQLRLAAERKLKAGELRAVVATASLELGIDIGSVDLVCQIGSPRSIAVALQRVGRAAHKVDRPGVVHVPKGRLFATSRDELIECAALVRAIRAGHLDQLQMPAWPRDVLAQQIVAAAASEAWTEDALFGLARRAYPYRELPRPEFDALIEMLSDGIATRRGRSGSFLHRDRVNGIVRGRRGARLAAITSGGAIPDNAQYFVVAEPEGVTVGTLDEDFAVESMAGDVFLLGTTSWRIRRVEAGRVRVEDARGAAPSIPFWRGEAPGRTRELSEAVAELRELVLSRAREAGASPGSASERALAFLMDECGLDRAGAGQAAAYVVAGAAALGALPSQHTLVAERFFDESGGMQLVLHAPFGARINRAWGLSLRKRFCRTFNFELQAAATDNGIVISLSDQHSFPLEIIFRFLNERTVEHVLTQAMLDAPMFTARWRWNASRALAILRFAGGRKVPPPIQRMRSDDLLAAVFPDQVACAENLSGEIRIPDHPLVNETIRDCLHEAMDLEGLKAVLRGIDAGRIRTVAIDTAEPSPLSHEILNANPYAYLDDAPLEERRARAVQMRRTLGPEAGEIGALSPAAIVEVTTEAWPIVRDADELHDALLTLGVMPPEADWLALFEELTAARRATTVVLDGRRLWTAAERLRLARAAYGETSIDPPIAAVPATVPDTREGAVAEILRGWLESSGPTTASALAGRLGLPADLVGAGLGRLEAEGLVLRGRFTASAAPLHQEIEWCNRRLLARIHRLTLGRLRREIEPVTSAQFTEFLLRWQHLAPGTQLHGADGLRQILRQLQGLELSAASWEQDVLRPRLARYEPELLDELCLTGEVMWGRLSPHPAFDADAAPEAPEAARSTPAGLASEAVRPKARSSAAGESKFDSSEAVGPNFGSSEAAEPNFSSGVRTTEVVRYPPALGPNVSSARRDGDRPRSARRVRPTRTAPVTLFLRDDADWLLGLNAGAARPDPEPGLSHPGREVLAALRSRGASFIAELIRVSGRLPSEVEDALWELAAAGLVTADGFDNLRALIDPKRRRGEGRGRTGRPRHSAGRWALLHQAGEGAPGAGPAGTDAVEAFGRQLLLRWGVVFRDLAVRETLAPPWRELLAVYRRLEARGEIRGGRFVAGFVGEQFARPEAVDLLRSVRRNPTDGGPVVVSAADPLNLTGIVLPGPRVSALSGERVTLLPGRREQAAVRPL